MKIEEININDIKKYENNPRKNIKKNVDIVKESISNYGMNVPLVIDENNTIICGHIRFEACKELGFKTLPCVRVENLTEEQIKAYRLVDNRTSQFFDWDVKKLNEEMKDLNLSKNFKFDDFFIQRPKDLNPYTQKIDVVKYDYVSDNKEEEKEGGEQRPKIDVSSLYNGEKVKQLNSKISLLDISEEERSFLLATATRFYDFNFKNIANFYALASKETQEVMEELALVIVDYNRAIELGFVKLNKTILDLMNQEKENKIEDEDEEIE